MLFGIKLGTEFLPKLDEGSIFLRGNFPSALRSRKMRSYAPKNQENHCQISADIFVITQTGRNDDGTDPFPANRNEILGRVEGL